MFFSDARVYDAVELSLKSLTSGEHKTARSMYDPCAPLISRFRCTRSNRFTIPVSSYTLLMQLKRLENNNLIHRCCVEKVAASNSKSFVFRRVINILLSTLFSCISGVCEFAGTPELTPGVPGGGSLFGYKDYTRISLPRAPRRAGGPCALTVKATSLSDLSVPDTPCPWIPESGNSCVQKHLKKFSRLRRETPPPPTLHPHP